ncbi:MAG: molybdopterin cofactor-binding domain-containing protein [Streptosporangiaceae bacterium]
MKAAPFDYHRPLSADAAVTALAELGDEAKVLAGGQSLVPVMAMRLGRPEHLVDINRIGELSGAAQQAAVSIRERVLAIAAAMLEASPADLTMSDGRISVAGDPDAGLPLRDVATAAYLNPASLPPGTPAGLEVSERFQAPMLQFSNAAHACTVEVDPATGVVRILRYVVSEDCGNMINPMVVEGQIAGGVVQGIGGVFYEHMIYDPDGNPLTTTFLDYQLPTAAEVPDLEYGRIVTPGPTPGGYKGMGEGGAIASPAALINAVRDALAPFGARITTQPLTPDRLLDLIDQARPPG